MARIRTIPLAAEGMFLIETQVFADSRGCLLETYNRQAFLDAGLDVSFVQCNESFSRKGVLRGLHYQVRHPQGKLVHAAYGTIFDVGIDLRAGSPTWGRHVGAVLSAQDGRMLYIPAGFAHGFLTLSDTAAVSYLCTDYYHPEDEAGIVYDDPDIGIEWPLNGPPVLSEKDRRLPRLRQAGRSQGTGADP